MKQQLSEENLNDINMINNIIIERLKKEDENFIVYHAKMLKIKSDRFFLLAFNFSFLFLYFAILFFSFMFKYNDLCVFLFSGIISYLILNTTNIFSLIETTGKIEDIFEKIMNKNINEEEMKILEKHNFKFQDNTKITYLDLNILKTLILSGKITRG